LEHYGGVGNHNFRTTSYPTYMVSRGHRTGQAKKIGKYMEKVQWECRKRERGIMQKKKIGKRM